jgi:hypothetical protein
MKPKKIIGGEVFASGGFGCVFNPALKCKGKKRTKGNISKLMLNKYALQEYSKIKKIKYKVKNIPNYTKYFLLYDIHICKPDKLTKSDLKNYTNKCDILIKNNITKKNINESLNDLISINIPNGGITIDNYVEHHKISNQFIKLNNSLTDLLVNGIIKMNDLYVYHCDIKDNNILVKYNNDDIETRLIDWGLSTEYIPFENNHFPETWRNRPLQYNVPFSVIIFTDYFVEIYSEYIKNGGKIDYTSLKPFVIKYIHSWIKKRGIGHYKFINSIMSMLFNNINKDNTTEYNDKDDNDKDDNVVEKEITIPYISNYIIEILIRYTKFKKDGSLNFRPYLDNVFIKNVDVWGFIMCYLPLLDILYTNNETHTELFIFIKHIFVKYLYFTKAEPININELTLDLRKLNEYFEKYSNINSLDFNFTNNIKVQKKTNVLPSLRTKTQKIKRTS